MFTTRKELWFNVQDAIFFGKVNWFSKSHIIFFSILLKFTHCSLSIRNPLLFSLQLSSHSSYLLSRTKKWWITEISFQVVLIVDVFRRPTCRAAEKTGSSLASLRSLGSTLGTVLYQWTLSLYIYGTLTPSHKSGKKWGKISGPYAVCRSACIMYTYVTCNIIL